jgi:hypothetical protein
VLRRSVCPVLLSLVLLSACGDDGLPKDEFVAKAESICKQANDKLEAEPEIENPDEIAGYFRKLLDTADEATKELEELAADQPDEDEINEIFLDPLRGQVDELQDFLPEVEKAIEDKGAEALDELEEPDLPEADAEAMEEYGFDACVETANTN